MIHSERFKIITVKAAQVNLDISSTMNKNEAGTY